MLPTLQGRWTRDWIRVPPAPPDASTTVTWLQAARLYCDLRVPPGRPAFDGCTCLADCGERDLDWLASQEAFAGHLETAADLCVWHRHVDFRPPGPLPDAGVLRDVGDCVLETGVFAAYEECWRCTPTPGPAFAAKLFVRGGLRPVRHGVLVVLGAWFAFGLERDLAPQEAPGLFAAAFDDGSRAARLRVLDCEISLGARAGGAVPWEMQHSTLPYLEGRALFASPGARTGLIPPTPDRASLRNARCDWRIDQASPDFTWYS